MEKSDGLVAERPDNPGLDATENGLNASITGDAVESFLRQNPDFLVQNPHLLSTITPPTRWSGDSIVDMQRFIVDSLRGEIDDLRECASSVIETGRSNMAFQTRTHDAVLAIVAADSLEQLADVIEHDFPAFLDLESAALMITATHPVEGIHRLRRCPPELFETWLGDRDVALIPVWHDAHGIFGSPSADVRSVALVRLRLGPTTPDGLLALGAAQEETFHPKQGTELLRFLTRVVERCLGRVMAHAK